MINFYEVRSEEMDGCGKKNGKDRKKGGEGEDSEEPESGGKKNDKDRKKDGKSEDHGKLISRNMLECGLNVLQYNNHF